MSLPDIAPGTILRRSASPVETTVGPEVMLMSLDSGECFGLGETGSAVWRLLAEPNEFESITAALRQTYDAPPGILEADVRSLLEDLLRRGLIEVS